MYFQLDPIIEFQFLFYLIPVFIGIQLAFYFFYQYYKIKDVNLKLNRILLSFGTFILFMVFGALIIQIARNFATDPLLKGIIYKIGWSTAFFSPIALELFILTEDFSKIVNLKLIIILMVLNAIAIVLSIIAPTTRSPIFFISIGLVILNGINIIRFEIILIKKSVGKIKKKFKQFFIGTITSLMAIFFAIVVGLGVLKTFALQLIIYYIGVSILLSGFILIFSCAIDFPPFYEFEWRENLLKLYIINRENYECIYDFKFYKSEISNAKITKDEKTKLRDNLMSSGLIGIDIIISKITGTEEKEINKIKHEDSYILLEYGTAPFNLIYALLIRKDSLSTTHLLQNIKRQFESFYREILLRLASFKKNQELLFGSFDVILNGLLK
ncbi:MAG: hypothetical protein ACFE8M_08220 [Candidatus Hermodarchaeota archaeon]